MSTVTATRLATIKRAIDVIDSAAPADLTRYLAQASIHDYLRADPALLRSRLAGIDGTSPSGARFGAWKAAQQILDAAGLPY